METLEAILTRRSIRQYQPTPVPEELVQKLLAAAMSAPSARNSQPWRFVVIDDRELLDQAPAINPYAEMARRAPLAILICADPGLEKSPGYWMLDCAAAAQNMLLAAHGLGLGAVWCGVYPRQPRIEGFRRLLGVPEEIIPHSLIVVGYPTESHCREDRFQPDRVYRNGWTSQ
jgi:nitroreductase